MTTRNLFINVLFLLIAIIFSAISQCSSAFPNKQLCYDPNCSEPISLARTSIKYNPNTPGLLPFDINVKVTVYSKGAGNGTDYWGVKINGKHGFVPKRFLKEYKVYHKDLNYEVPVNKSSSNNTVSKEKLLPMEKHDKSVSVTKDVEASNAQVDNINLKSTEELPHNVTGVSPSYEIIDGTTLHLDHSEPTIQPSFVREVTPTTEVPNKGDTVDIGIGVNSVTKKSESNIFMNDDKSSKEIMNDEVEKEEQSISPEIGINKDFVKSSEEIISSSEIDGVNSLDTNANILNNFDKKLEHAMENTENNMPTKAKDAQSLVNTSDVNITETPTLNDIKKELNATISNTNIESNIAIKLNEETNPENKESTGEFDVKNSLSLENATQSKENETELKEESQSSEQDIIKHDDKGHTLSLSGESNLENVTEINLPPGNVLDKVEQDEQSISPKIGINTDFVKSSEEILSSPEVNGVNIPSLDTNASILNNFDKKLEHARENTENDMPTKAKDAQSLINLSDINVTETPALSNLKKELEITISNTDVESNKNINQNEGTNSESKESIGEFNVMDSQSLENATQSKAKETELKEGSQSSEQDIIEHDNEGHTLSLSGESNLENVTKVNLLTGGVLESIETETTIDVSTISSTLHSLEPNLDENSNIVVTGDHKNQELQKDPMQSMQIQIPPLDVEGVQIIRNETSITDNILDNINRNAGGDSHSAEMHSSTSNEESSPASEKSNLLPEQLLYSNDNNMISDNIISINEFHNRNLLNAETVEQFETENVVKQEADHLKDETISNHKEDTGVENDSNIDSIMSVKDTTSENILHEVQAVSSPDTCTSDNVECTAEANTQNYFEYNGEIFESEDNGIMKGEKVESNYWLTLIYLSVTATATLIFSLGYYYIENMRRDGQLIAKINKLEKDLLVSTKECTILNENLKLTKDKLTSIEDESFGSNEMVLSLKADLEASQNAKVELEEIVTVLEKDLESATEAGLELERMLREVLSSNSEVNPLAESVEDLQKRLNIQQAANESLTNALSLKTQENETLSSELASFKKKYKKLEAELTEVIENLQRERQSETSVVQTLTAKVQQLEMQFKEITAEKMNLQKELKNKEAEMKELTEVIDRLNTNNLDLDKLYDVSHVKAEATALLEERNELQIRLAEVEGAHSLLEEHMKVVKEEVSTLSEQCKVAEKEKKDAETRLEVLSNFFKEKEAQRQKEEAIWLQQQGEVVSTVERIQTMQNEIQNYKQQIEMLKREILDQEREYKNQISVLETKAHEQWVIARQVERRLEESKVEAGQLRNRLTLIEKNMNDVDSEAKLHRLEANGETTTSPPLFMGAESSSSPIMFSGSSSVPPPPPPSYLHSLFPPYLPPPLPSTSGVPPYEVSQRPPPLGGRLSSPPPMPLHPPTSSRYDNAGSPPPMSPHLLPHFNHRSPPPPFGSDHMHPPPPASMLSPPLGTTHSWREELLPHPRNSGFHPPQRERVRNHKGSLHSSGESLDKTHNSKV